MRLRQQVALAGKDEASCRATLKRTTSAAVTLLRHTLIAFGEEAPSEAKAIFARIAERTGAEAGAFETVYDYHEGHGLSGDSFSAYDRYLHALEKVIRALDQAVPKREWQRLEQQGFST